MQNINFFKRTCKMLRLIQIFNEVLTIACFTILSAKVFADIYNKKI